MFPGFRKLLFKNLGPGLRREQLVNWKLALGNGNRKELYTVEDLAALVNQKLNKLDRVYHWI